MSPPLARRRIDGYDGQRVTSHSRSHTSERVERETVEGYTVIGRMMQQVFAKGVKRIRYYGGQATKTFAKMKGWMREALSKIKGVVQGAGKILARRTSRQRYQHSSGREPLLCPHCHHEMGLWKIWHPKYGGVYDETRGHQKRAVWLRTRMSPNPERALTSPLGPLQRNRVVP